MQRSNLIVFIVLSALVLGGWFWMATSRNAPKDSDQDPNKKIAKAKDDQKTQIEDKKKGPEKEKKPPVKELEKEKKPSVKEAPKEQPAQTETLGGPGFNLTVDTISRGAGIRRVTLNRFKAADWQGRPTDRELEIIQDDEFNPPFRMYHYRLPKDENPVFGLGEEIWNFERIPPGQDDEGNLLHRARYWTTVPGLEKVKIVKTYSLVPQAYHVKMVLEIHDERANRHAPPIPFRYQLTGAQGIPIEGEWYTAIFRNAIMGLVDRDNNLWRKLEESARISGRRGGDTWPDDKYSRGNNRMQYAGVVNQYFGVMIIVDNEQPSKDEGGTTPDNILAWARPTLETVEKHGVIEDVGDGSVGFREQITQNGKKFLLPKQEFTLLPRTKQQIKDLELQSGKEVVLSTYYSVTLSGNTTNGKTAVTMGSTKGVFTGMMVTGAGIPTETTVAEITDNTSITLSQGAITTEAGVPLTFWYRTPSGKRVATWVRKGETLKPQFDDITVRVNSEVINLQPREVVKHQFMLYFGPVKAGLLAQFSGDNAVPRELVNRYTDNLHLRTLTDYHSDNWFGKVSSWIGLTWLIIKFTQLMHELLYWLQFVFGYGLGIVVLTVIVRGAMFPISRKQALFSIRMQELAPELKKIQQKYPDDAQARMQATQEFYRKHGINPLGSCWPVFLQMPIFLGLYFALQESVHFRLADFLWIKNLAAPDMLIYWSENIPIISSPDHAGGILGVLYLGPYFNVLPVFAVVFMMIVQMQTMPPPTDDQQAMQQKMLKFMSIFFGIMFYKVAAGLCIYFITSSLWGMAERKLLPKKKPVAAFPGPAGGTPPAGTGSSGGGAPVPKGPLTPKDKGKWGKKDKEKAKDKEAITTFDKLKALWREILKQAEKK